MNHLVSGCWLPLMVRGQLSASQRPAVSQSEASCQPIRGQLSANQRPDVSQSEASCQPIRGQLSAIQRPAVSQSEASCQPIRGQLSANHAIRFSNIANYVIIVQLFYKLKHKKYKIWGPTQILVLDNKTQNFQI